MCIRDRICACEEKERGIEERTPLKVEN